MSKTALALACVLASAVGAQTIDRTKPPQTPPIPTYKLPPLSEARLPNGLSVVLLEDARFPLLTLRLNFLAGSKFDPQDQPGLSENVAALLIEGTKTRSSRQIAEQLAAIGGSLNGTSGPDSLTLAGNALAEHAADLLALVADVARNATFPDDEVKLRQQNRKQSLRVQKSDPSFLANERLSQVIFGAHPYAHIAPTMEALDRLDRKTLAGFHDTYLVPNNAVLILVGKWPAHAKTMELVREQFGSWPRKATPAPAKAEFAGSRRELVLVDRPGSVQADIHLGRLAITRSSPEYFPLMVGSTILGTGGNSRLFKNIREKRGFAYDVHSFLDTKRDTGVMTAVTQVRNEVVEPAMQALLEELKKMASEPVTATELSEAKNFISGLYLLRLETQDALANQLNLLKTLGLPNEFLETYTLRVRAVEPDQILAAARKYIAPDRASIVVVGDASKIGKALEKFKTN